MNPPIPRHGRTQLWLMHADQANRSYLLVRDTVRTWLAVNGVDPDAVLDLSTLAIVQDGPRVYVATRQADRNLAGKARPCPYCQHCVRSHDVLTLITSPMPVAVAAAGWPDADAADDWLTQVNEAVAQQTAGGSR